MRKVKKGSIPLSGGCSMLSFLVVGCSIRASLTWLFYFKSNDGRGTSYPPPLEMLRPSFSNFNRSPTYCTITAGCRILHTIISGRRIGLLYYELLSHAYLRKKLNGGGRGTPIPYPPPARCIRPSFRADKSASVVLPLLFSTGSAPGWVWTHHCPPTFQNRSAHPCNQTIIGLFQEQICLRIYSSVRYVKRSFYCRCSLYDKTNI